MAKRTMRPGNLPAETTSFVGRRQELAEVKQKLQAARVVSLVGPGGVGKTRLALHAAAELARGFAQGAWLVELADVNDPALVGNAALAGLDLRDQAAARPLDLVVGYLKDKELLLVLDNCEHLLESAADLVIAIVRTAPKVRIIATSREPLGASGEYVVPVPPLNLPPADATEPINKMRQHEAVMLFLDRAEAASGAFRLNDANQAAVAKLCRRLDGLPLAIELAAVRTRVLTVEEILERLSDRFGLLVGGGRAALPRHQTLRTAIDWSHELLTPAERMLFRRLCVFAGRFTLEDVEAVCAPPDEPAPAALELLASLVDKSLVVKEDARARACYRLHETMREYAALKLREAGEEETFERRCTTHYVTRCQAMVGAARYRLLEWLPEMDLEIDNIRSVLRRCLDDPDATSGIILATSLSWFWVTRATTEGVRWLDELLAANPQADPGTMAWAHFIRGFLAVLQGDWAAARPALESSIAIAREARLPAQLAHGLAMASIAANMAGDRPQAVRLLGEAQSAAARCEEVDVRIGLLQARALNGAFEGDVDTVKKVAAEGGRLARDVNDLYALQMMLLNQGSADLFSGALDESKTRFLEALQIAERIDDRIGQFYLLAALAFHESTARRFRIAAQLLGASETIRLGAGATAITIPAPFIAQAEDATAAALGQAKFQAEVDIGRRLSREAAIRLALGEPEPVPATAADGIPGGLGRREADVARLIVEGLSNKEIGARLFISERTVDSHVRNILNKLGFNSRAQIASWVSSSELSIQ